MVVTQALLMPQVEKNDAQAVEERLATSMPIGKFVRKRVEKSLDNC
jgi:hypothetical protein